MTLFIKILTQSAAALCVICGIAFAQQQQQQSYYSGDGGKGIRLAVLEPAGKGLSDDEQWMPSLVQGSIAGDFNKFSAMTIIDRQNLDKIFAEWKEGMSDNYSEADRVKIGNLANASHILTGSVSKTANSFMLELAVTDVASGVRRASYSPTPVSALNLENLSAIKAASADLLKQLGVSLTDAALGELRQTVNAARVQAEAMLARGIAAQRQGTEVAALSYFFQAAALDSSLLEASNRSLVMAANISSGNIGADARNDIAWRKNWLARLEETEKTYRKMIDAADPPYSLSYSTNIRRENINYQKETIDLSIDVILNANKAWFNAMNRSLGAADAVLDGLNSTGKRDVWGLGGWPDNGVSQTNPFYSTKRYDIAVVFELVNERGRAIGSETVSMKPSFYIRHGDGGMFAEFTESRLETVKFGGVKADDISNNLTIRVASVNGAPPQNARFTIRAISVEKQPPLVDRRDGKSYNTVKIGGKTWMAENLNYLLPTGKTGCYGNDNSNCYKYGRLYAFGPAEAACPDGWHLPTREEWKELVDAVGGSSAGKNLRAGEFGDGTDIFGFSALGGGYGYKDSRGNERFTDAGSDGYWWVAAPIRGKNAHAYSRRINNYDYRVNVHEEEKDMNAGN
jgi:uncharacterized protein (TIGR02145 family)